jgi:molybdopterin molybdotransferase
MAMTEFLEIVTSDELRRRLGTFARVSSERISLDNAIGRYLAEDVLSPEDLPERPRSTVDGYAVKANDTFGASDSLPALLRVSGAVEMGKQPDIAVEAGSSVQIPTGGFLPSGADAVVMVEYTDRVDSSHIEVAKPVTLRANVLDQGEDARKGTPVLPSGRRVRAQEVGFLAALGIREVSVFRRVRLAVISTGDEIVPVQCKPAPGQIRDANGHSIAALVRGCGAEVTLLPIVPDNESALRRTIEFALEHYDVVVLSGGSSVGMRDLVVDVLSTLPRIEILAHGIAIRPGKPALFARRDNKAIVDLPGHPVSALIVAHVFLAPLLEYLQGGPVKKGPLGTRVAGRLATSMHSTIGLEEYVRVRLVPDSEGQCEVHPVFGKSSMLSTMVRADGLLVIPSQAEGLSAGEAVEVVLM